MAVGAPSLWSLLVQWDGTTYVDETANLKAGTEVTIERGRGSFADDVQPGVLSGTFDNTGGRYTSDNALSPLYPNLNGDKEPRTRFAVTIGGVASDRHRGRATLGEPTWPDGDAAKARVAFQSVGPLGQISRDPLQCDFVERHLWTSRTTSPVDVFPLDETVDASTTSLRNIGNGGGTARLVRATTGVGSAASETPEGVDLEASIKLTPSSAQVGPVIVATTGIASGSVKGIVIPFRTDDRVPAGGAARVVAQGLDLNGRSLWSLQLVDNAGQTDLNFYDSAGGFLTTMVSAFAPGVASAKGDDQWFSLLAQVNVTGLSVTWWVIRCADDVIMGSTGLLLGLQADAAKTASVVLGGFLPTGKAPGKQQQCTAARFGAVAITSAQGATHTGYLEPNALEPVQARYQDVALYTGLTGTVSGTRNRDVRKKALAGRDGLEVLAELARTVGGAVVESRTADDTLVFLDADTQRRATVALEVSIAADVDGSNGWPATRGSAPREATATWTGGRVTYTDASRAGGSKSVDTAAASSSAALDVASSLVNSGRRLRIKSLRLDISGSDSALWPTLATLEVGARIRVQLGTAGSPFVTQWGSTYVDVYAVGWTEHYTYDSAWWEIDTEPADDPPGAVTNSTSIVACAARGAMTVAPGTLSGTAGLGTIVVTTVTGPTLSTDASDYPRDFNVGGERMTVSTAPASSSSPQTLTVTARGVAPSVGKVHVSGEPFDVWFRAAATW